MLRFLIATNRAKQLFGAALGRKWRRILLTGNSLGTVTHSPASPTPCRDWLSSSKSIASLGVQKKGEASVKWICVPGYQRRQRCLLANRNPKCALRMLPVVSEATPYIFMVPDTAHLKIVST